MYERLELHNFTAFADAGFEFVSGVNAYAGVNGSGKTHILKIMSWTNTTGCTGERYERRFQVRKRAHAMFHDEELHVTLPDAWMLVHVDDDRAPWAQGWQGCKVDWAWNDIIGHSVLSRV